MERFAVPGIHFRGQALGTRLAMQGAMSRIALSLAFALAAGGASAAQDMPCQGAAPAPGVALRGPVLHILDGRTLCVARGADPSQWAAVRLADAPTAPSWGALMGLAFGKDVECVMQDAAGTAVCRVAGQSLGPQLSGADVIRAGAAWGTPRQAPSPRSDDVPMQVASAR